MLRRPNWNSKHPPFSTCYLCHEGRLDQAEREASRKDDLRRRAQEEAQSADPVERGPGPKNQAKAVCRRSRHGDVPWGLLLLVNVALTLIIVGVLRFE